MGKLLMKLNQEKKQIGICRKPTICPNCGKKEVRKAVLGYPKRIFTTIIFFNWRTSDYPVEEMGCRIEFFKDNKFNRGRLDGVLRDKDGKLRLVILDN